MKKSTISPMDALESTNTYSLAALLFLYIASVVAFIIFFSYTGYDDSFITYYVADQIAHHHGITNYSQDHIEQSSSLLWSSLVAFFVWLTGLRAAFLAPIMSFFSWQLLALCITVYSYKRRLPLYIALASVLIAPLSWWALSGMEIAFYILCLMLYAISVDYYTNRRDLSSITALSLCSIAITLIRPEGMLVLLCTDLGMVVLCFRSDLRKAIEIFVITVISVVAAILTRFSLGLRMFPNPVYAKEGIGLHARIERGFSYLDTTFHDFRVLSFVSLLSCLFCLYFLMFRRSHNRPLTWPVTACLCMAVAIGAFAILSGGDWMWYGRFFVPFFFLSCFAGLCIAPRPYRLLAVISLLFATGLEAKNMAQGPFGGIPVSYAKATKLFNYRPATWDKYSRIHARDIEFIDKFISSLRTDPRSSVTIASRQAGMVMYYVDETLGKRLNFIDLAGLSSTPAQGCYNWGIDPYIHWKMHEECINRRIAGKIDYLFDLDHRNWPRMSMLEQQGCQPLIKETTILDKPTWKQSRIFRQFAVKCH